VHQVSRKGGSVASISCQGPAAGNRMNSDLDISKKKLQSCRTGVGPYSEDTQSPLNGQAPPARRPRRRRKQMKGLWRICGGVVDLIFQIEGDDDEDGGKTCFGK
jgi:hypothetical protein